MEETANFVKMMDTWFDYINTRPGHRWRNWGGNLPLPHFFSGGPNLLVYFYNIASA